MKAAAWLHYVTGKFHIPSKTRPPAAPPPLAIRLVQFPHHGIPIPARPLASHKSALKRDECDE